MRIRSLDWRRYRIPLAVPFETAHGPMRERTGLIVRLVTEEGIVGLGEAAPVPGFGPHPRPLSRGERGDEEYSRLKLASVSTERLLASLSDELPGRDVDDVISVIDRQPDDGTGVAAVRCALDTALLDALGKERGVPVAMLLSQSAGREVPVNATVGAPGVGDAVRSSEEAVASGFRTVKLKVGTTGSLGAEVERVVAVRRAIGPGVALRLDANGGWSVQEALAVLREVAGLGIELVEQPVDAADLEGLRRVRQAGLVPVGADEAVTGLEAARRILELGAADVLVIKPMMAGGLRAGLAIAELAAERGARALVTTTIDTGVGVAAALQLAAALPDHGLACGLATASLLSGDVVRQAPEVVDGRMRLPAAPGLGVVLDDAALRHFGDTPT